MSDMIKQNEIELANIDFMIYINQKEEHLVFLFFSKTFQLLFPLELINQLSSSFLLKCDIYKAKTSNKKTENEMLKMLSCIA